MGILRIPQRAGRFGEKDVMGRVFMKDGCLRMGRESMWISTLLAKGAKRMGQRAAAWLLAMGMAATGLAQGVSTTTVQGTVYLANGQPGAGTLTISWPAFTTSAGQAVVAESTTVTIAADGFVSVSLAPNQGATPAGEYYTAVFYMSDGSTSTQYWVVPAAASATLAQVQAQVMPAAQAVQTVSKAYVDQAVAEMEASQLTASGGTLTGPLYLNADPTQPMQAATKHYVDGQVATALPLTGGTVTGTFTALEIGGAYEADQFPGADIGAKIQACVNALSAAYGGTCDARNFTGNLTMGSNLTISTGNTTVLMPCATITTANQIVVTAGTRNVSLRGCALRGGSPGNGSQGGTALAYSGAGAMIQVGDPTYAANTLGFHMDNMVINTTAAASGAQGFVAYRTQELDLESLYFLGNSNQTGMTLDGTGNYTGGTFLDNELDGFGTAVNAIGHQVANAATTDWMNASTFVRVHIDCATSNGSPISGTYGINLQQGDGNTFTGGDVEGCGTVLHLGPNAQDNTIVGLRNENSTSQVVADAGSQYNLWMTGGTMFIGKLTDNGEHNSFTDAFHRGTNNLNGDVWRSQADSTVINHIYTGIGLGNVRGVQDEYTTDVAGAPGSYQNTWLWGPGDGTTGVQVWELQDMLNSVNRLGIIQSTTAGGNDQSYLNAAGTGSVCFNCSANSGTGGVVFDSGGSTPTEAGGIDASGNLTLMGSTRFNTSGGYQWSWNCASTSVCALHNDGATTPANVFRAFPNAGTEIDSQGSSAVAVNNTSTGGTGGFSVYGGGSYYTTHLFDVSENAGAGVYHFPGVASSSGYSCLQVDQSGYLTNTGAPCGTGSGSGGAGGTIDSGNTGQIAYYTASGTTIGGMNAVPVAAGGTGATSASGALGNLLPGAASDGNNGVAVQGNVAGSALSAGSTKVGLGEGVNITSFGADATCTGKTATVTGSIASGSTSVTLSTNGVAWLTGMHLAIPGAGTGGNWGLATVSGWNATTNTLTFSPATATAVSNVTIYPDDTAGVQDAINAMGNTYALGGAPPIKIPSQCFFADWPTLNWSAGQSSGYSLLFEGGYVSAGSTVNFAVAGGTIAAEGAGGTSAVSFATPVANISNITPTTTLNPSGGNVAAGTQTVTPGSMLGIYPGTELLVSDYQTWSGVSISAANAVSSYSCQLVSGTETCTVQTWPNNTLSAGNTITFGGFQNGLFLNGLTETVLSTGLSSSQFEVNIPTTAFSGTASGQEPFGSAYALAASGNFDVATCSVAGSPGQSTYGCPIWYGHAVAVTNGGTSCNGSSYFVDGPTNNWPGTLMWYHAGSTCSASSASITGINEWTKESVAVTATSGNTFTAAFGFPHLANAVIGQWALMLGYGAASEYNTLFENAKDIQAKGPGGGIICADIAFCHLTHVSGGSTSGETGEGGETMDSAFVLDGQSTFAENTGHSYAFRSTYNCGSPCGGWGSDSSDHSNFYGGVKVDSGSASSLANGFGGSLMTFKNDQIEDPFIAAYAFDTSGVGAINTVVVDSPNLTDNLYGALFQYALFTSFSGNTASSTAVVNSPLFGESTNQIANANFCGHLSVNGAGTQVFGPECSTAPINEVNAAGESMIRQHELVNPEPQVIPSKTLSVPQTSGSWVLTNCTATATTIWPSGPAAYSLAATGSSPSVAFYRQAPPTLNQGDIYVAGAMTYGLESTQFGPLTLTVTSGAGGSGSILAKSLAADPLFPNDPWHFDRTMVVIPAGATSGSLVMTSGCPVSNYGAAAFPRIDYFPASLGWTPGMVQAWMNQNFTGPAPSGYNNAAVPATPLTESFGGLDINGSPLATGNLADWTDSGAANGYVPVWNATTDLWTPGALPSSVSSINGNSGAFTLTGAGVSCAGTTCTIAGNTTSVPASASVLSSNASSQLTAAATTGSGSVVLATSPTLTTPALGAASATSLATSGSSTLGGSANLFNNTAAAANVVEIEAGTSAAQNEEIQWQNYSGAAEWQNLVDTSYTYHIKDAANNLDRMTIYQGGGNTNINAGSGAYEVCLNCGASSGTAGLVVENGGSSPSAVLTVTGSGNTTATGFVSGKFFMGTGTMTLTAGAASGSSPTIACASGHVCDGVSGTVTLTTGTSPTTGTLATLGFPNTHTNSANCMVSTESASAVITTNTWTESTTAITITANAALTASTAYTLKYWCGGN